MRFAITGLGVVSPAGVGEAALFESLAAGRPAEITVDEKHGPGARVGEFGAKQQIAAASLRRMPRRTPMALVAAKQALAGAAFTAPLLPERIGVVLGTGLGTLDETIDFMNGYIEGGPEAASPLLFPYSVMNAAAGQLAVELKLRGVNSTVNHRDASSLEALGMACDLLELGRADALLVGGVDELSGPARAGYHAFGAVTRSSMRPYDASRDGLTAGRRRGAGAGRARGGRAAPRRDDSRAHRRARRVGRRAAARRVGDVRRPQSEAARAVAEAARGREISWVAGQGNGTTLDEARAGRARRRVWARCRRLHRSCRSPGESLSSAMVRLLGGHLRARTPTIPDDHRPERSAATICRTAGAPRRHRTRAGRLVRARRRQQRPGARTRARPLSG